MFFFSGRERVSLEPMVVFCECVIDKHVRRIPLHQMTDSSPTNFLNWIFCVSEISIVAPLRISLEAVLVCGAVQGS